MIARLHRLFNIIILHFLFGSLAFSQPQQDSVKFSRTNPPIGHISGRLIDSTTQKPLSNATLILSSQQIDPVTKKKTLVGITTVSSSNNGAYSFSNIPLLGRYVMQVDMIGYRSKNIPVSFIAPDGLQKLKALSDSSASQDAESMFEKISEKNINVFLSKETNNLNTVVISATKKQFEMGIDKKVFNVDNNLLSTGQTATEVMRNVPLVNVDIDGNISLRNGSPTLFVDGKPTTLTLDQIPANIIDKVEIITNPSAKYDASGGQGGIVNLVLKKQNKQGYNGGLSGGIDSRARVNVSGNFNVRYSKFNVFASAAYKQRKSISTLNSNLVATQPYPYNLKQTSKTTTDGYFTFVRGGFDYLPNEKNTLTVSGHYVYGYFPSNATQVLDSIKDTKPDSSTISNRITSVGGVFKRYSAQIEYRHDFAKKDHNISAFVNYSSGKYTSVGNYNTFTNFTTLNGGAPINTIFQKNTLYGLNNYLTIQADYANPLHKLLSIEAGVRSAVRWFADTTQQSFAYSIPQNFVPDPNLLANYKYIDQTYAGYINFKGKYKKLGYQAGLRAESYTYKGTLFTKDTSFNIFYPISLFPSVFLTYDLNMNNQIQLNYSRRVDRPSFLQLLPVYDFSDIQNPSIGNPALKPQYTETVELNYNFSYLKASNLLVTFYFKYLNNLITRYQYLGKNISPYGGPDSIIYNTFINSNGSYNYGLELTNTVDIFPWWNCNVNLNIFNVTLNGALDGLGSNFYSLYGKMNHNFKITKTWAVQFSGYYQSKSVLVSVASGSNSNQSSYGQSNAPSGQGFSIPRYSFDIAIRKDFVFHKIHNLSLTLSMSDIFRTQVYGTNTTTNYFTQSYNRRRDPQLITFNASYRFGKFTAPKQKNVKAKSDGSQQDQLDF